MITNSAVNNALKAPVRQVIANVSEYDKNNKLINTFYHNGILKSVTIDRVGDNTKFFGFGVCHKANIHLLDQQRELSITTENSFYIPFQTVGADAVITSTPRVFTTEVHRDENTNELSITAYDKLYEALSHTIAEVTIEAPYTLRQLVQACISIFGTGSITLINIPAAEFDTVCENVNLEGTETIREVLDMVAERTQSIYYLKSGAAFPIVFKRLDISGNAVYTVTKADYITLKSGDNRRLTHLIVTNSLGDAVSGAVSEVDLSGSTQYVRDNAFYELQENIADLVDAALANVYKLTINQFDCVWRGNYLLEVGDKIDFVTKDNNTVTSYLLNDTIEYNGSYKQKTSWSYEENEGETADNPSSLGEALKYTFAKVDKINKEITIVASEVSETKEDISKLYLTTEAINASVEKVEKTTTATADSLGKEITTLKSRVDATITADDVNIAIKKELENGANKVTTATGFTFNETGLTVNKTDSEMTTQITEDGMKVLKDGAETLTANNEGVKAKDLHAKTYLIVGDNSRFENYGSSRTGCFWIG